MAPIGYPHKNPIIIAGVEELFSLNNIFVILPKSLESKSIIPVFKITSLKNINGKSEGIMFNINKEVLDFTDSKFCFEKQSNIKRTVANTTNFIILFTLYDL